MVSLGLYVSSGKPILAFIKTYWLVFHVFLSFFYLKKKEKSFNYRLIFFVLIPTILVYTHAIPVHGTTLWSWTYYFFILFLLRGYLDIATPTCLRFQDNFQDNAFICLPVGSVPQFSDEEKVEDLLLDSSSCVFRSRGYEVSRHEEPLRSYRYGEKDTVNITWFANGSLAGWFGR